MQGKLIHYASFSGCRGLVFRVFYLKTQYFRPGSFNITLGELFTFLDILKGLKTLDSYRRGESHGLGRQCPLQSGHSSSSPSHSSCPLPSGKTPVAVKNVESKCRRQNGLLLAFKKEEERHAAVEVGGRGGGVESGLEGGSRFPDTEGAVLNGGMSSTQSPNHKA